MRIASCLLTAILALTYALPTVGQDANDDRDVQERSEKRNGDTQALREEIDRLQELVDVQEADEAAASRELLRRYRRAVVDEKGNVRSDEALRDAVLAEIHEKLIERLGPERTKQVMQALKEHHAELADQSRRSGEVAEKTAESDEEWAKEFAQQVEAEAEAWGERLEDAMEAWGEQQAEVWEKWAEEFGAGWEAWAEDHEQHWNAWGEKFEAAWEEWGEKIERGELSKKEFEELWQKNLEMLGEMPIGELYEQIMKSTEQLKDIPFEKMQGMEDLLRESVAHALSGLEHLRQDVEGSEEDRASQVKSLTKLLERMQSGLDAKRVELDAAAAAQLAELKALTKQKKNRELHEQMMNEVHEHLRKLHEGRAEDMAKHAKYVQELHERLAKNKDNNTQVLAELMQKISDEREQKHEADSELDALRAEIKALRQEIKQLRKEQGRRDRN